jgi:cell division protein FtsW
MISSPFARHDRTLLGRWWWTVDRLTLLALLTLMMIGTILIAAGSPAVAERTGLAPMHFIMRHMVLLGPAIVLMLATSLLNLWGVRIVAWGMLLLFIPLLALTLVMGSEAKGASRWIYVAGLSVQPSEFVKPAFAVVSGFLLSQVKQHEKGLPLLLSIGFLGLIVLLLMLQPDLGQSVVLTTIWIGQLFLAGVPLTLGVGFGLAGMAGVAGAYLTLDHVYKRINGFLNPDASDTFQIDKSIAAFAHGGITGTGPGQGTVKNLLPDAHADFIFAVAGEEFGLFVCLGIVLIFAFIVVRGLARVLSTDNLFVVLAVGGLLVQFGAQALINMGSSLHLIPTKGMTLPFLSYGGSSLLALGLAMGLLLALTRKRTSAEEVTP